MKKKDRSMKYDAWWLWWVALFLAFMLITEISPSLFGESHNFIIRIVISAILASLLNIVMFKAVFPNMIKNQKAFSEIMDEMKTKGISEQLKDKIIEQYNICAKKPSDNHVYMLNYSTLISSYYADVYEDFATAYKYLDNIDLSQFAGYLRYSETKAAVVHYYLVKLQIECDANDKIRADGTYQTLINFCEKYQYTQKLSELKSAGLVFCSYRVLCGDCQSVINELEQALYDDEIFTATKLTVLAEAYTKLGDTEKAISMWEQLPNHMKGNYVKDIVQRKIKKLKSKVNA